MKMSHYLFKLSNLVDRKVTFLGIMKMDRYMFKLSSRIDRKITFLVKMKMNYYLKNRISSSMSFYALS